MHAILLFRFCNSFVIPVSCLIILYSYSNRYDLKKLIAKFSSLTELRLPVSSVGFSTYMIPKVSARKPSANLHFKIENGDWRKVLSVIKQGKLLKLKDYLIHLIALILVPSPTVDSISKSSIKRFTPGRPAPSPPEVV